jgi:imidazolonepropionase-like amidohydrolase
MSTVAIANARLFDGENNWINNGVVVFKDAQIIAAGAGVKIPDGAKIIDVKGAHVTPGLVDAHTHLGNFGEGEGHDCADGNEMTEACTPHARALDSINPLDMGFPEARLAGITSCCVLPGSGNVIGGLGVAVKTAGNIIDDMVIRHPIGLKIAFGENPKVVHGDKRSPQTRMGVASVLREELVKTQIYMKKMTLAEEDKRPDRSLRMEAIAGVFEGKYPLRAHMHRSDDIATAVRIADEFGLKMVSDHCTGGHHVARHLAKRKIACVCGPHAVGRFKQELRESSPVTASVMEKAGCLVAITTDHPVVLLCTLRAEAAMAHREGLSELGTLKAITGNPASIGGVGDRVGFLKPGYDADIVVWSGHPLQVASKPIFVFINGKEIKE